MIYRRLLIVIAITTLEACANGNMCSSVPTPPALSRNIHIDIRNGAVLSVNAGGERLLRDYAATRQALSAVR